MVRNFVFVNDNYRHSDDQGKRTIESVAGLAAQSPELKAGDGG